MPQGGSTGRKGVWLVQNQVFPPGPENESFCNHDGALSLVKHFPRSFNERGRSANLATRTLNTLRLRRISKSKTPSHPEPDLHCMEGSGPRPRSSNTHYDRLISPKIGGDIAEDGAKDRGVAPTNLYRYELQHCCSNGCVRGVPVELELYLDGVQVNFRRSAKP